MSREGRSAKPLSGLAADGNPGSSFISKARPGVGGTEQTQIIPNASRVLTGGPPNQQREGGGGSETRVFRGVEEEKREHWREAGSLSPLFF